MPNFKDLKYGTYILLIVNEVVFLNKVETPWDVLPNFFIIFGLPFF